MDKRRKQVM